MRTKVIAWYEISAVGIQYTWMDRIWIPQPGYRS